VTPAELGRQAELSVADYLFADGFSLLGRNVRLGRLELDVVARKGPLVVVVEVRTRRAGAMVRAFESVTWRKRARLARAVDRLWRDRLARTAGVERVRVDAAAVAFVDGGRTEIEYAEGIVP